jgi:hypothetical protein
VARVIDRVIVYGVLVGGPEGNRPFGKPKYKWKDNIKRIFKK